MNLLNQINELLNKISKLNKHIDIDKMSMAERVTNAGFIHEGNTYLGLFDNLVEASKNARRTSMFNDINDWIPSLEYYIDLLKENYKFCKEIHQKQESKIGRK